MRVKISPYTKRLSTHGMERAYMEWRFGEGAYFGLKPQNMNWFDTSVVSVLDFVDDHIFYAINQLYFDRKKRKIQVRIDDYDCWSLDHTLALIIVPALEKLRDKKHGAPNVANEDVPERLQAPEHYPSDGSLDDEWFARWDYVLNEMIFAFDTIRDDTNELYTIENEALNARVDNGLRLFAKYYRGLWD